MEGSAADARVLRDSISRPNGLKIPRGNYYLVDSGYSNGEGFLSPYRGVRSWTLMGVLEGVVKGPKLMRTYACISDMLARSGFGWNEAMQMIVVSDEVFDNYDKAIPVSPKYYVPSPDTNALADDHNFMNSFTQSTAHLNATPSDTERVSSKKRTKSISIVDEKFDAKFDTFDSITDNRFGDLAKYFGAEQDESHAPRQVWSDVECMSDLTIEQKCVVSKKLVNNKNDLDLF
ncbi:UNVERIFIED_CONTAM: hypothetical protein Slati_3049800 [Sesamum latifolium]|uniref:DDE Tnp4 domain-containing protein n=1 Tax=Sesamum latifolium TaxID=2727402 RepID=A0AAW2UTQ8_9LAMI